MIVQGLRDNVCVELSEYKGGTKLQLEIKIEYPLHSLPSCDNWGLKMNLSLLKMYLILIQSKNWLRKIMNNLV